ncbi:uncharacterized protein LOC119865650 isoform X6 [Canis lupus familiaris]|uniref:uncharacterized protein LOC119865650 isoform X6 n=1 Tax=Canis lupus familiaris TaxID=9615 RepID=UPI0018F40ECD|nr:uncharacterized protein LOC119865650 isoform X6 [Canis lupus familiaris]
MAWHIEHGPRDHVSLLQQPAPATDPGRQMEKLRPRTRMSHIQGAPSSTPRQPLTSPWPSLIRIFPPPAALLLACSCPAACSLFSTWQPEGPCSKESPTEPRELAAPQWPGTQTSPSPHEDLQALQAVRPSGRLPPLAQVCPTPAPAAGCLLPGTFLPWQQAAFTQAEVSFWGGLLWGPSHNLDLPPATPFSSTFSLSPLSTYHSLTDCALYLLCL